MLILIGFVLWLVNLLVRIIVGLVSKVLVWGVV